MNDCAQPLVLTFTRGTLEIWILKGSGVCGFVGRGGLRGHSFLSLSSVALIRVSLTGYTQCVRSFFSSIVRVARPS